LNSDFYHKRGWPSLVKVRASQARDRGFKSRTSHFLAFEMGDLLTLLLTKEYDSFISFFVGVSQPMQPMHQPSVSMEISSTSPDATKPENRPHSHITGFGICKLQSPLLVLQETR
jgi:hypothetical protein